jgi:hypothetical protein
MVAQCSNAIGSEKGQAVIANREADPIRFLILIAAAACRE